MTDAECLDWLEQTNSGLYHHMSGFGPVWEVTSLHSSQRFHYRTCREAIKAAATKYPTREALNEAYKQAEEDCA